MSAYNATARLLSVHVGKPRVYDNAGRSFKTAIVKQQTKLLVPVTKNGIDGDMTASHKNAVYLYSAENYDHWNDTLSPAQAWSHGFLGENLTVKGLDETTLHVGDKIHIGSVTLEVSGCRTPCETFLWRTGMPPEFLREFQMSGKTGFYCEVIAEGHIAAGDEVFHEPCNKPSISVTELAEFFLNAKHPVTDIDRLLTVQGMGPQMLAMLTAMRNQSWEKQLTMKNRWEGWRHFSVTHISKENPEVKSFTLKPVDGGKVAGYRPGQHVTVKLKTPDSGELIRSWSLSDYDETLDSYRISIKRIGGGKASNHMHDTVSVGDTLELLPPNGLFTLDRAEVGTPIILIGAGVGITPLISMLKAHAKRCDEVLPTLLFLQVTRDKSTDLFRSEIDAVVAGEPSLSHHLVHTRPRDHEQIGQDYHSSGRLDAATLEWLMSNLTCWFAGREIETALDECDYYLCGPISFMDDVRAILTSLGVADHQIKQETFSAASNNYDTVSIPVAQVTFSDSSVATEWRPSQPLTLLELAEDIGLEPVFGCRSGTCGLCAQTIKAGDVTYIRQPTIDVVEGKALLCCTYPNGDLTLNL